MVIWHPNLSNCKDRESTFPKRFEMPEFGTVLLVTVEVWAVVDVLVHPTAGWDRFHARQECNFLISRLC